MRRPAGGPRFGTALSALPARSIILGFTVLGVLLAAVAGPVAGHGVNYASFDPQVTADGSVVVESAYLEEPGWVVVYDADEPVGHAAVGVAGRTVTDVAVPVDADAWPGEGEEPLRLRVELFADDGDDAFDPAADRQLLQFGPPPEAPVERGDAETVVLAERGSTLPVVDGELRVRRAALPADGHVVVERENGTVLGTRSLSAGSHRNVSVDVGDLGERTTLVAALYRDDADGSFGDEDEPFHVGDEPVATTFDVEPADEFGNEGTAARQPGGGDDGTATGGSGKADGNGAGFELGLALAAAIFLGSVGVGAWLWVGSRRAETERL